MIYERRIDPHAEFRVADATNSERRQTASDRERKDVFLALRPLLVAYDAAHQRLVFGRALSPALIPVPVPGNDLPENVIGLYVDTGELLIRAQ
jgi:hypothetical protein